jgi:hypothetical protein
LRAKLKDVTWELASVMLTQALSSEMRKAGLHPLTIDNTNDFENYQIEINKLDAWLHKATVACKHHALPSDASEKAHYTPLNACVDACSSQYQKSFYEKLKFTVFNSEMQDKVLGINLLQPDSAGTNVLPISEPKLWWHPESGKQSTMLEIPIEVTGRWTSSFCKLEHMLMHS